MVLAERLIGKGVLHEADLARVREAQAATPLKPLHEILIEHGFAREEDVLPALAEQLGMELVDLTKITIEPATLSALPLKLIHRRTLMPLSRQNGTLVVATADPQRTVRLFRGLFGDDAITDRDGGQIIVAGASQVELSTPDIVRAEFGEAAADPAGRAEYMAALGIRVGSLREAEQCLRSVPGLRVEPHRLVVPAGAAFNTTIAFSE